MSCTVEKRNRVRAAANGLANMPGVVSTDVIAPDIGPGDSWELEIVVADAELDPLLLEAIAGHRLSVVETPTRGDPPHTVATLRA
jgi:hypothetical protein